MTKEVLCKHIFRFYILDRKKWVKIVVIWNVFSQYASYPAIKPGGGDADTVCLYTCPQW